MRMPGTGLFGLDVVACEKLLRFEKVDRSIERHSQQAVDNMQNIRCHRTLYHE